MFGKKGSRDSSNNVMIEIACENNGKCDVDQRSFKAYLSRWMGYTAIVAPWTREFLDPMLQTSAKAAAAQCTGGNDQTSCGLRWVDNGVNDGSFGVGEQMAALEIVQSLLYPSAPGPASVNNGGISKSDPNAGAEAPKTGPVFNPVASGDKAGAGILTLLVLSSIITGAWWMVS
jgi:mannan endo-1,6-alpha-mannosidase